MIQPSSPGSFSASVKMDLTFGGIVYPVAQVGGGRLYFDSPVSLPTGEGELVMSIDGRPRCWRVRSLFAQESVCVAAVEMGEELGVRS